MIIPFNALDLAGNLHLAKCNSTCTIRLEKDRRAQPGNACGSGLGFRGRHIELLPGINNSLPGFQGRHTELLTRSDRFDNGTAWLDQLAR
jgi:hypothetical protein